MSSDNFLDDEMEDLNTEDDGEVEVVESSAEPVEQQSADLIQPVSDDLDEIKQTFDKFQEIKSELLEAEDRQSISGNVFIKKSGWRKIATAFNISTETISEERVETDGVIKWTVKAVATAPNGVEATGIGMATSNESNFTEKLQEKESKDQTREDIAINYDLALEDVVWVDGAFRRVKAPREVNEHNLITLASTRAKNRAISDLVGGGEVSQEEMTAEDFISS